MGNQTMQRRLLQAKLTVSQPEDRFERQADRVADAVMRMPAPAAGGAVAVAGPSGDRRVQRLCRECDDKMHRKPAGADPVSSSSLSALMNPRGGRPLSDATRSFFEPRFGHDFSGVRVHTNAEARDSARAVNALAYTVGRDIVFAAEQYAPDSASGKRLLAHELAHVVQQGGAHDTPALQRQPAVPAFRDCTPAITGIADSNERLEAARLRARDFVDVARAALAAAPAAGTNYAVALNRHFIAPNAADRAAIEANYQQIMGTLVVGNYICNSQNICGTEQAFWLGDDDLVHVCRPFWADDLGVTCRAIILIHEGAHDVGVDAAIAHPPNRGSANYPAGNVAPPAGETTAGRMTNPDAFAFFAAHIWRSGDTGRTCF